MTNSFEGEVFTESSRVRIGKKLCETPNADLYQAQSPTSDFILKIFNEETRSAKIDKIERMLFTKPSQSEDIAFLWPESIIEDPDSGESYGCKMEYLDFGEVNNIHEYTRQELDWSTSDAMKRWTVAYNIARAVSTIHDTGHAVGDFSHDNFLVDSMGRITLINCDRFFITDGEDTYPAQDYHQRYAPPEGLGTSYEEVKQADLFGLGVHIFQILMEGTHPFQTKDLEESEDDLGAFQHNNFPYTSSKYEPVENSPQYEDLPQSIRELFSRTFQYNTNTGTDQNEQQYPDSNQWIETLRSTIETAETNRDNDQELTTSKQSAPDTRESGSPSGSENTDQNQGGIEPVTPDDGSDNSSNTMESTQKEIDSDKSKTQSTTRNEEELEPVTIDESSDVQDTDDLEDSAQDRQEQESLSESEHNTPLDNHTDSTAVDRDNSGTDHQDNGEDYQGEKVANSTTIVSVADKIGTGLEGAVYYIENNPNTVLKLFTSEYRSQKQAKVEAMLANKPDQEGIIWPEGSVEDPETGEFLGYEMAHRNLESTKNIFEYAMTELDWETSDSAQRFAIAHRLAIIVASIHNAGHAIGDFSHENFRINQNSKIISTDCDSFYITHNTESYPHNSSSPRYTPPEGTGTKLEEVKAADRFALSVHIFQLLMEGFHPYQAKGEKATTGTMEDHINNHEFPYLDHQGFEPISRAKNKSQYRKEIPEDIRELFSQSFIKSGKDHTESSISKSRPTPEQWATILKNAAYSVE